MILTLLMMKMKIITSRSDVVWTKETDWSWRWWSKAITSTNSRLIETLAVLAIWNKTSSCRVIWQSSTIITQSWWWKMAGKIIDTKILTSTPGSLIPIFMTIMIMRMKTKQSLLIGRKQKLFLRCHESRLPTTASGVDGANVHQNVWREDSRNVDRTHAKHVVTTL